MKELVVQLTNPNWETLRNLLTEGSVALGDTHELMLRGTRLIKALEKESAHQRYRKNYQKNLVKKRASARKFVSVEKSLDKEFIAGRLNIVAAPQSPPVNLKRFLTGDDGSPEKEMLMSPNRKNKGRQIRPEINIGIDLVGYDVVAEK